MTILMCAVLLTCTVLYTVPLVRKMLLKRTSPASGKARIARAASMLALLLPCGAGLATGLEAHGGSSGVTVTGAPLGAGTAQVDVAVVSLGLEQLIREPGQPELASYQFCRNDCSFPYHQRDTAGASGASGTVFDTDMAAEVGIVLAPRHAGFNQIWQRALGDYRLILSPQSTVTATMQVHVDMAPGTSPATWYRETGQWILEFVVDGRSYWDDLTIESTAGETVSRDELLSVTFNNATDAAVELRMLAIGSVSAEAYALPVPEPATWSMLAAGGVLAAWRGRRRVPCIATQVSAPCRQSLDKS